MGANARPDGQAALRAALEALDAARVAVKAALGEADGVEIIDLEDHDRWLVIKQAAGVARCHPKTIERRLPEIGVKVNGRWYVDRFKLLENRAR